VYLVFLVLPGVGEAGDDGGDAGRGGDLAGVDHDQQLHEVVVDLAAAALHDVHVLSAHALPDLHTVAATHRGKHVKNRTFSLIPYRLKGHSVFNEALTMDL